MGGGSRAACRLSRRQYLGGPSVEVLLALVARTNDEDQLRSAYVEAKDVPGRAEWNDELAQCWALTDFAVAVGRGRKMTVGNGANDFESLVGAHGVFDSLGTLRQEVERTIQICVRLRGELDLERHFRSCFTRAAIFASSFDKTTSDGMEIPVRSYAANEASQRAAKSVCTRRNSTARQRDRQVSGQPVRLAYVGDGSGAPGDDRLLPGAPPPTAGLRR